MSTQASQCDSEHAQHQHPETEISFIISTCAFTNVAHVQGVSIKRTLCFQLMYFQCFLGINCKTFSLTCRCILPNTLYTKFKDM